MKQLVRKTIKFPSGFWSGLEPLSIAPEDVARQAGLPLTIITEPKVTADEYFAVWQAFSDLMGDISNGIIGLVTVFETAQYPPDVLATYHARDYRDALCRMVRYKQMCPPESLLLSEKDEECTIELQWQPTEEPGPAVLVGIILAYLLELGRRGTGRTLNAQHVEFSQPMGDVQVLERYFGCPVRTDAERNRLTLRSKDLNLLFTTYNEELLDLLTPVLDRTLDEKMNSRSCGWKVKWVIKQSLRDGRYDIQTVARELNLSDRTLQRRLTEEGTSFKQLLTQARHEQAKAYLADLTLDIKEVARLIGYEDQNSFYRAFRLWEGDTPARWRAENAGF